MLFIASVKDEVVPSSPGCHCGLCLHLWLLWRLLYRGFR